MKGVKCSECGFVGWADAERCKKCGVVRMADPELADDSDQFTPSYRHYPASDRIYSQGDLKKGLAIAALVLGILNLLGLGILVVGTIVGITLALVAMSRVKQNPDEYGGKDLATAGLVLNLVSVAMIVPVLIIAAIAIPNLMAARIAANEGATINTLRKIHAAEATYQATRGNGAYGTLDQLGEARLLNVEMASTNHYGYKFTVNLKTTGYDEQPGFQVVGVPLTYGSSGTRSFYIDETGVIRGENNRGAEATELSPPLNSTGYSSSSPPSRRDTDD